jgi:hypothetical protein
MKLVGRKGCLKMTTRLDENLDLKMCYKCGTEYFKDWPRCPNCMAENNSTMDKCVLFKGIGKKIIAISLVLHCLLLYTHYWDISLFTRRKSESLRSLVVGVCQDEEDNKFMAAAKNPFENKEAKENLGLASMDTPETGIYQIYTNEELITPFNIPCNSSERMYLLQFNALPRAMIALNGYLKRSCGYPKRLPSLPFSPSLKQNYENGILPFFLLLAVLIPGEILRKSSGGFLLVFGVKLRCRHVFMIQIFLHRIDIIPMGYQRRGGRRA